MTSKSRLMVSVVTEELNMDRSRLMQSNSRLQDDYMMRLYMGVWQLNTRYTDGTRLVGGVEPGFLPATQTLSL